MMALVPNYLIKFCREPTMEYPRSLIISAMSTATVKNPLLSVLNTAEFLADRASCVKKLKSSLLLYSFHKTFSTCADILGIASVCISNLQSLVDLMYGTAFRGLFC